MKIYKKILNLGYGICCLLPIIYLLFCFLYVMKTGENGAFDITKTSNFQTLGDNLQFFVKGELQRFSPSVEWFDPFFQFNKWVAETFFDESQLIVAVVDDDILSIAFVIYYAEWVVLVSFFRLFGSVFGCMINFADRMLDKIGGTN